jgi:hypothetical protein
VSGGRQDSGGRRAKLPATLAATPPSLPTAEDLVLTRQRLMLRLMRLAEQVAESYCVFAAAERPSDPDAFAAHHTACQTGLNHLDLLLRIIRQFAPEAGGEIQPALMIADARQALMAASPLLDLSADEADALEQFGAAVLLPAPDDALEGDDDLDL